jgi:hypothetical protein
MSVQVDTEIRYSYKADTGYGYELRFEIPSIVSPDGKNYLVAAELRSDKKLFRQSLNLRKPIPTTGSVINPGDTGPSFLYVVEQSNYPDIRDADNDAAVLRDASVQFLQDIANINLNIYPPSQKSYVF